MLCCRLAQQQHDDRHHQRNDQRPHAGLARGVHGRKALFQKRPVHAREDAVGEQRVDADHQHQRKQRQHERHGAAGVTTHVGFAHHGAQAGIVVVVLAIALAGGARGLLARAQPQDAQREHDGTANQSKARRREGVGAEILDRNRVLDRWRARQRRHGEGERTQRNRRRHQALGDVGVAKQRLGDGVNRKRHHEQRHAAVRQYAAGQHHRQDGMAAAERALDPLGDGGGRARISHQLAKQRTQQKDRKEREHVVAQRAHEGLGVDGQHLRYVTRQNHGQRGHDGRQQQHRVASVGKEHQQQH